MEETETTVVYASMLRRLVAYAIDCIALLILLGPLYYNGLLAMNLPVLAAAYVFGIIYKPLLEFIYGKTIGKVFTNIKVVDGNLQKPALSRVLFRNIFFILPSLISGTLIITALQKTEFKQAETFMDLATLAITALATSSVSVIIRLMGYVMRLLNLADIIVALTDKQKQMRTIHDRIGGTYVIRQEDD